MNKSLSSIELLESRIAPASFLVVRANATISANALAAVDGGGGGGGIAPLFSISTDGRTVTYTDLDGDLISVAVVFGK